MKKIITLVVALVAMTVSVSAKNWTNFVNVGWRIPTSVTLKTDAASTDSIKISPITGLDLGYTGCLHNGFSVRAIIDLDYSKSKINSSDDDGSMANFDFLFGIGYAPIHTDELYLGFFGMIGCSLEYYNYESTTSMGGVILNKIEDTAFFKNPVIGLNTMFVYTPFKVFSLYASLGLNCLLPGDLKVNSTYNGVNKDYNADIKTAFMVVPAIGLCWKF